MSKTLWESMAAREAELLIRELGIDALPVLPLSVAEKLGIDVQRLPSKSGPGVSGMLLYNGNEFGILYSTSIDSRGFQHFSIGHEIGHFRLPGHFESLLQDGVHASYAGFVTKDRYELEADHFSAGLLMPGPLFDKALDKAGDGIDAVTKLADQCITSLPATAIRVAQRSPEALAIVVSCGHQVDYCFMSDTLREVRGLEWLKKGSLLPQRSMTRSFNGDPGKVARAERADGNGHMQDWFGGAIRAELFEEVIGLGSYGRTLTVLTVSGLPEEEEIEEDEELVESWTPRFRR